MWGAILTFLKSLTVYTIVYPNELAIKTRGGVWHSNLDAGFYWQWPIYDYIWKVAAVSQIKELPSQSIGVWLVSGVVEYSIIDVKKALLSVEDFDEKLVASSMYVLFQTFIGLNSVTKYNNLAKRIMDEISTFAEEYGLNVTEFRFTSLAKHRVFRVLTYQNISGGEE